MRLAWNKSLDDPAARYLVWRLSPAGALVLLTDSARPGETYVDTPGYGAFYRYQVSTVDSAGRGSLRSNPLTGATAVFGGMSLFFSAAVQPAHRQ